MNQLFRPSPVEIAKELMETRFKGAEITFVAGSIRKGEATSSSDIDLVVVYPKIEAAYRESFIYKSWPIEAFVHDPETLNYFFWELDAKDGTPSLPNMVVEGAVVPESHPWCYQLKSLADRVLDQGPEELSEEQLKNLMYGICDLIDDLKSPRNAFEAKTIISKLHEQLGNFWFRSQRRWSASGKHIPRRMLKIDPAFGEKWIRCFDLAFSGQHHELIKFTEEILTPFGGHIFDGYLRKAPKDWRKPLPTPKNILSDFHLSKTSSGLLPGEGIFQHKTLGSIKVRLAQLEAVPSLRKLLNSSYKKLEDMGLNFNATFQDDELTAEGILEGLTFVLERADKIIATMKLQARNAIDNRACLYIGRFAVDTNLQSQGLGLFLLNLAEKLARRENCICMQLDTAQPAQHLIKFYQDYGFKIMKSTYFEGKTYCSWIMEKTL
ncbi:MAG: GNAT family N-acetyltransferase [Bdellovibrionales bacterium]|nr:GNAT family N-acetyltransferase [Bdellovibrionales bacterium]